MVLLMSPEPRPRPKGFREDVVRVAHNRERGVTIAQVATDFGISESCLRTWLLTVDVEYRIPRRAAYLSLVTAMWRFGSHHPRM